MDPKLIPGDLAVDDRGEVGFVNAFDFAGVKRFYTVANHAAGLVRAWHGHQREAKFLTAISGAMMVCVVKVDNWQRPSKDLPVSRFVLSAKKPAVLFIPAGYANGLMSLTADAKVMVFSTSTLEESRGDDIRFPARLWDPWAVEER